jgi:hypothetical protein
VFDVIGVAHRDQRQLLPPSICHIGRDVEKVLEKEEGRKSRAWDLTLEEPYITCRAANSLKGPSCAISSA